VRIGLLGGLSVEHDGIPIPVSGSMQLAVLFRLAVDAGTAVSYRAIAEDIWGMDAPENAKGALQSIISRLRSQLPAGSIESTAGGYRLALARSDVDALEFSDRVAAAEHSSDAASAASEALAGWSGEPWIPSDSFDWFVRDLTRDHAKAVELGGTVARARATELPAQLTSLVGREIELGMIADQLRANRLVTIIGTGGAGKTRLALETASSRKNSMLVELAPVGPSEVLGAVLTATGREIRMVEAGTESTRSRERVIEALAGRDVLLVFDNCEHVIDAAASIAQDLLSALPLLRILATSREPLGVPGEAFVGVGSLPHPAESEIESLSSGALADFAALELFRQRAMAARGTDIDDDELRTVAGICARLDGLPLAIELAAAKLRTMGVDEVLSGLDDRFTLLNGGYRTALPRHQTLRAMIDWSWSLLDEDQRRALTRFAVFPAGVSVADARLLASRLGVQSASVFDSLVDRSLLQRVRGRFRALETVREYGMERLAEVGELAEARLAQAEYMDGRAREMDGRLRGPHIMDALRWFDDEQDNLASALRYATGIPLPALAVHLAMSCAWYWLVRDRNDDAREWFTLVAPLARTVEGDEARVLTLINEVVERFGDRFAENFGEDFGDSAPDLLEVLNSLQALELGAGSHELLQLIVPSVGAFAEVVGTPQWMTTVRLPPVEELGLDPWPTAILHVARAAMAQNRGAVAEQGAESGRALELFTQLGDVWGLALSEQMHSMWLAVTGRLEEALELSDSSTEHMREITSSWDLAQQQGLAIQMLVRLGRHQEALDRVTRMVADAEAGGNARTMLQAQIAAASVDVELDDLASARTRLAVINGLHDLSEHDPGQLTALVETIRATIDRKEGNFDDAEAHLRAAAEGAVRSHDHPVIGMVAIAVGSYALARGNVALAVQAVDFATAVSGAYDATHPEVVAIAAAAAESGIGRPSTEVPGRPIELDSLQSLIRS
jgi:predicted ATPase